MKTPKEEEISDPLEYAIKVNAGHIALINSQQAELRAKDAALQAALRNQEERERTAHDAFHAMKTRAEAAEAMIAKLRNGLACADASLADTHSPDGVARKDITSLLSLTPADMSTELADLRADKAALIAAGDALSGRYLECFTDSYLKEHGHPESVAAWDAAKNAKASA